MKFVEFVVAAAGVGDGGVIEVVVVVASWLCLPCRPLWSNGPYQRKGSDKRMRHKEGS